MNRRWVARLLFALGAGLLLAWLPYLLTQGVGPASLDLSGRLGLSAGVRASTFAILFAAGVLTSLTPCVYPLIPITVGVFGAVRLLAMDVDDVTAIGAFSTYPRTSVVEGNQVIRLIGAPYRFRSYRGGLAVVFQNKTQTSQYRAVGHPIACAVTERLVDMAAAKLGLDPFEIRSRNIIRDDMYPYTSPTGYKFERLSHEICLNKLREMMAYDLLRREPGIRFGVAGT